MCVWVGGWVGGWVSGCVSVCLCVHVCVCVGGGGGIGGKEIVEEGETYIHTAAVTQRERRERREGGDL